MGKMNLEYRLVKSNIKYDNILINSYSGRKFDSVTARKGNYILLFDIYREDAVTDYKKIVEHLNEREKYHNKKYRIFKFYVNNNKIKYVSR